VKRRAAAIEPSNADLVHEVLRSAERPLTLDEISARVNERRLVTTANPLGTIRSAVSQGPQLVGLGDGRYGYLPHLIEGSLLRLPLTEKKPANHALTYPDEVRLGLFPSCLDIQKRKSERPAQLRLPNGGVVELPLEFLGTATWGTAMPDGLRRYLVDERAAAGDSLLIRVVGGEDGSCEAWFESRGRRDELAVARRNRELADATQTLLRGSRSTDVHIWDLIVALLARSAYHSDVAPDPLENVLGADSRFVAAGFAAWMLEENVTPALRVAIRQRQQDEVQLFGLKPRPESLHADIPIAVSLHSVRERLLAQLNGLLGDQNGGSIEGASARLQSLVAPQPRPRPVRVARRRRSGPARIYQLKVTLKGIRPPIWRRLLIRADTKLEQLHEVLQTAMGWYDSHLHQFVADGVQYGVPDDDWGAEVRDESLVTLADVAPAAGDRLLYEYDFGDGWEHDLLVEKVLEPEPGATYPVCLKGRRARPPEDVGGIWGYAEFLQILSDPDHPEYEERLEWIGGEFDPEEFDAEDVNAALASLAL
jgi:Plasmid pRiA4b ORF-3-like protein